MPDMNSLTQGGDRGFVLLAMELHISQSSVLCQRRNFVYGRIDKYAYGLYVRRQILHQLPNRIRADVPLAFGNVDDEAAEIRFGFVHIFNITGAAETANFNFGHAVVPPLSWASMAFLSGARIRVSPISTALVPLS